MNIFLSSHMRMVILMVSTLFAHEIFGMYTSDSKIHRERTPSPKNEHVSLDILQVTQQHDVVSDRDVVIDILPSEEYHSDSPCDFVDSQVELHPDAAHTAVLLGMSIKSPRGARSPILQELLTPRHTTRRLFAVENKEEKKESGSENKK